MPISSEKLIVSLPSQILREPSKKVGVISNEVLSIIENMKTATLDWEDSRDYEVGVALSAVQINCALRIVIIREDPDDKNNRDFLVFINPVITKKEGNIIEDYEGCLSVKDIYGKVPRYEKVRIKALDIKGREFRMTATGFLARVMQHEVDHTRGTLFIDHIKNKKNAFFTLDKTGHLKETNYDKEIGKSSILW